MNGLLYDLAKRLESLATEEERLQGVGGSLGLVIGESEPISREAVEEWQRVVEVLADVVAIAERTFAQAAPSVMAASMTAAARARREWESTNPTPLPSPLPGGRAIPADAHGSGVAGPPWPGDTDDSVARRYRALLTEADSIAGGTDD